jgi:hypothetical protein
MNSDSLCTAADDAAERKGVRKRNSNEKFIVNFFNISHRCITAATILFSSINFLVLLT